MEFKILLEGCLFPVKIENCKIGTKIYFYPKDNPFLKVFIKYECPYSLNIRLQHWKNIKKRFIENQNPKPRFWHEEINP